MSVEMLEVAAQLLGELCDDLVFLGGATVGLWVTDPAAPPPRSTRDVDALVQTTTRQGYREVEQRLERKRFRLDIDGVTCRFVHADAELVLDVMPTASGLLGLRGDWLAEAYAHATTHRLPSGRMIRLVDPPHLLATKLEAFGDRGADDFLASDDFADIVTLLDGRSQLLDEVLSSPQPLRRYVARRFGEISVHRDFVDGLHGNLPPDRASQAHVDQIILPRIEQLRAVVQKRQQRRGALPTAGQARASKHRESVIDLARGAAPTGEV